MDKCIISPSSIMQGQLYVDSKSQYGFVVKELNGSDTTAPPAGGFDYLVIARRKGFEDPTTASSSLNMTSPTPTPSATPTPSPTDSPTPTPDATPTPTP